MDATLERNMGPGVLQAWRYLVSRSDEQGYVFSGPVNDDIIQELESLSLLIPMEDGDVWLNPTHTGKGDQASWADRTSIWDEAFIAKARLALKKKNWGKE
jgi:hypothetical protein